MEMSFSATWSKKLLKHNFTQVSNQFLDCYTALKIASCEALFIIHCIEYKWSTKNPYPSFKTIATKMGKSRSVIQRYARSLENKGLILRVERFGLANEIDITPLIRRLEDYAELHRVDVQKGFRPYVNLDTKEDALRRFNNKTNGIESVGEIFRRRKYSQCRSLKQSSRIYGKKEK